MNENDLSLNHCYRITFSDGQPIEFKFIGNESDNGSMLCETKGGETFFLETVTPFETISEIEAW